MTILEVRYACGMEISMLSRVIVKNFKSFKNETVFDYRKTNYKLLDRNTCGKLLKGVLFVGDNASGKTTAIKPVVLLLQLLFKDVDVELFSYQCMFSNEKKTSLRYEFEIDGHEIEYSFVFAGNKFLEEQLILDKIKVIQRLEDKAKVLDESDATFYDVDSSILFLKRLYFNTKFNDNIILKKWFDFLRQSVYIDAYRRSIVSYNGENLVYNRYFDKYGYDEINQFLKENNFKYSIQYTRNIGNENINYSLTEDENKMVFFEREEFEVPIPMIWESVGNKTLINILPAILYAVNNGGLLIIDEFSSGFHNKLEELIVKYIMTKSKNTQMFLVSHSTNLLSNSLLRPDQIYTVEMVKNQGSVLSRFSDEQPRAAQNLEKMYLSGVFGGIPEYEISEE